MAKPEWGKKRTCQGCGSRYYDMLRNPAICPKCGTEADAPGSARPQRSRPAAAAETAPPKAEAAEAAEATETTEAGSFAEEAVELEEVDDALEDDIDLDGEDGGAVDLPA